ncbi:hypothetical protein ACHQM5_013285 [Ranunculus cassubicifolius]
MKAIKLLTLLILISITTTSGSKNIPSLDGELVPVGPIEYHSLAENSMRRSLAPFQLCLVCKCCSTSGGIPNTTTCVSMPCCFGLDCELPNKPFGVCAFVPKTCNCTSCGV